MAKPIFQDAGAFLSPPGYSLLPFRFRRLNDGSSRILAVTEVGEHAVLGPHDLEALVGGRLEADSPLFRELAAKQFIASGNLAVAIRMLAAKYRTRKRFLTEGPALHIFVVSLRCDHSCHYCQVSRRSPDHSRYDMTEATAEAAINRLFESPTQALTVEFQGGEPLLAFDRVRSTILAIQRRNEVEQRSISFTVCSTLHHLTDEMLAFFKEHRVSLSTSLDGPAALHDRNRPLPGGQSIFGTLAGIQKAREALGHDQVAALTTLTKQSLQDPIAIIDAYVANGFRSIFLRPLSPYGFAVRSKRKTGYDMAEFVAFYRKALDYLIELNLQGTLIEEAYAGILLGSILTNYPSGYVDLRSPAGAGLGVLVYNYDGWVYASDEGRMLAEMGDHTFRMGRVEQPLSTLIQSDSMAVLLGTGIAESLPGCTDCAYLPYCGADPVHSLAHQDDPAGHRPTSDHCQRHMGMLDILFDKLINGSAAEKRILESWAFRVSPNELPSLETAA